jgi:outer membrane protein OmpA-like peptidoglycan-associated protein
MAGTAGRFATPTGVPQADVSPTPPAETTIAPPPAPPSYSATPNAPPPQQQVAQAAVSAPPQPTEQQIASVPPSSPPVTSRPPSQPQSQPATGGYGQPETVQVATIYFGNNSARLGARDRAVIREIVSMYRETGGTIRIIGHSSGNAASQVSERSKLVNFKVSLDRANAVAAELVRQGVPSQAIDVAAQGAQDPRYAEYSPTGAAANRRAEVYLNYSGGG